MIDYLATEKERNTERKKERKKEGKTGRAEKILPKNISIPTVHHWFAGWHGLFIKSKPPS